MKETTRRMPIVRALCALLFLAWITLFATAVLAQHAANPFVGATQYLNADYTAEVNSAISTASSATLAAQMKVVASYPTAVWMDHIAAIAGGTVNSGRLGLAQHIAAALSQQVGTTPVVVTLVIYDLPDRDCSALASNGEISIAGNGTLSGIQQYEQSYITPIYNILQSYATNPNLRFVLIIEPDSLPNLITNTGMGAAPVANCVAANAGVSGSASLNGVYVQGVQYALNTFHPLTNVYQYLDIGQSAWLGWPANLAPAVQMYNGLVKGTTASYASIDGFVSNTASYAPTKEPFMTGSQQIGGNPVISANFYQYDPEIDELSYNQAFYAAATSAGFPTSIGFLIDTSRNGWGGPLRPTAQSTATDVNTFVKASKIDERGVRGVWCNIQASGMGVPPTANPGGFANLQAYVWIKPPGESDGTYPGSTYGGVTSTTGDPNCNPANMNPLAGGATDSLPDSPPAGTFWPTEFAMNVQNAFPAIPTSVSSTAPGFAMSATAVTLQAGSAASSTVTITDQAGFTGAVTLTAIGMPTGVTAAFDPASVNGSGSSTLTFTASSAAANGTTNITVTGTSGDVTSSATVPLTVGSGTANSSAAISVTSAALTMTQGTSTTDNISLSGFSGNATLSASGLPSGVAASFTINPATTSSVLQLSAGSTAAAGPATVIISAASGSQTASVSITLTVTQSATVANFTVSSAASSMTIAQGASGTNGIAVTGLNGFSGNVALSVGITSSPNGAVPPTVSLNATSPIPVNGTAGGVASLTVVTAASTSSTCTASSQTPHNPSWPARGGAIVAGLLLLFIPKGSRTRWSRLSLALLFMAFTGGAIACSAGTNVTGPSSGTACPTGAIAGTTAGNYVITVTGTSGGASATSTISLTVR